MYHRLVDEYFRAVVAFFAIVDPIGNVVVFALLTRDLDRRHTAWMALLATGAALVIIAMFVFGGEHVLDYLDISEESFRIAAGALLLFPAYRLVEHGEPWSGAEPANGDVGPYQLAFVPLAIPLLAGPGALATAIAFAGTSGRGTTFAAAATVLAVALALFLVADAIVRVVGRPALRIAARLIGVLLMAIAVDLIVTGLDSVF